MIGSFMEFVEIVVSRINRISLIIRKNNVSRNLIRWIYMENSNYWFVIVNTTNANEQDNSARRYIRRYLKDNHQITTGRSW